MNPNEILRLVDSLRREKNIDPEIVFHAIEQAIATAARRHHGEESEIEVSIDRETGEVQVSVDGRELDPDTIGRIGAQTAKQVMIQKIREAARDSLIAEYREQIGQLVVGTVLRVDERRYGSRMEQGKVIVQLPGEVEAILPRSEQIPGTTHRVGERLRAVVVEARADGSRVKVVLSRTRPQLVAQLFEQEIPEITEGVIKINAIAREPGNRTKVAVSSEDPRVDCVGACVGVRGNRIKNILNELPGERIDIVRWSDNVEQLIPNALQPAEIDQVLLCEMIGRAIVLVREDQLSLAIGRKGQNVRLASKLCGVDIEIMTEDELNEQIERAVTGFSQIEGVSEELAQSLVEQGYLSYDDLEVIEPDDLMELGELTEDQVERIVEQAAQLAEEAERAAEESRRRQREQEREAETAAIEAEVAKKAAAAAAAEAAEAESAADATETAPAEVGSDDEVAATEPEATAATSQAADGDDSGGGSSEGAPSSERGAGESDADESRSTDESDSESDSESGGEMVDAEPERSEAGSDGGTR